MFFFKFSGKNIWKLFVKHCIFATEKQGVMMTSLLSLSWYVWTDIQHVNKVNIDRNSLKQEITMNRIDLMKDRILSDETVELLRYLYKEHHKVVETDPKSGIEAYLTDEDGYYCDEDGVRLMVTDAELQRTDPVKVAEVLLNEKRPYRLDEIIAIFSESTGRSKEDIMDSIFGTPYTERDLIAFYEPEPLVKEYIEFELYAAKLMKSGKKKEEIKFDNLPEKYKNLFTKIPDETFQRIKETADKYINYYFSTSFPYWMKELK